MRGMPTHPDRFGNQQRRPLSPTTPLGGHSCRRKGVEHVVAVERRAPHTIARRPVLEIGGQMVLFETGPERDLVVLHDEDGGHTLHRGEVGTLLRRYGVWVALT